MAQLYQQEFKTQEKAKYEHIRQAKEKALEEQRIEAEKRAEADRIARENSQKPEQADVEATQGIIRNAVGNSIRENRPIKGHYTKKIIK